MEATVSALPIVINTATETSFLVKYGGLIGSLVASGIALFLGGGGGRWLKGSIYKPKMKVEGNIRRFRQNHYSWRIAIKNYGNDTAKDVQVNVTKIIENGIPRENFLPMPLVWTHWGSETRNILPKQTVFLDVIEHHHIIKSNLYGTSNLATRFGGGVDDFRQLHESQEITTLELTFYEQRGLKHIEYIDLIWPKEIFFDARMRGHQWSLGIYK
ncbi:hypothetical protein A2773_01970 [Candidatus Gottesmanbacteria bacterium RIFCSPHIGHO2_01_FULL_39_10]|uniref:Uncharacterized protein n=1 Tax=Candidatus Gottesmanbacteria bacterium RIFCSPHIGHO2_01_FULL_39_10 TaxID=1798375 RepID=A0A1F5ZKV6_9BACT|nr:MAG: hypothetical protein A2773_01970 [Candidatus Gottesmanbacteria bacterium RIFCSPHIGHO2_01_FULL_39_10]